MSCECENKHVDPASGEEKEYQVVEIAPGCSSKCCRAKKILKVTGLIFGVLFLLLLLAFLFRDLLIATGVRRIGSWVTGTEVRIASFDSSLKGSVELKKIRVANPKGYQKPFAFEIDRIYVKLDPRTLTDEEPVVECVEVTGVRIDMEIKGANKSNLSDIQSNIEKVVGSGTADDGEEKKGAPEKKQTSEDAPAPIIRKIDLTSMAISFSSSTLKSSVPVPLAPVYLRNVGGKGQPLGETLLKVFNLLMNSVNTVGGTVMGGVEAVGNAGKAVGSGLADGASAVGDAGKKVGSGVTKGVKSIGDGIGGIFKRK